MAIKVTLLGMIYYHLQIAMFAVSVCAIKDIYWYDIYFNTSISEKAVLNLTALYHENLVQCMTEGQ